MPTILSLGWEGLSGLSAAKPISSNMKNSILIITPLLYLSLKQETIPKDPSLIKIQVSSMMKKEPITL